MRRYEPTLRYIGTGEYVPEMEETPTGDWTSVEEVLDHEDERGRLLTVVAELRELISNDWDFMEISDDYGIGHYTVEGVRRADIEDILSKLERKP